MPLWMATAAEILVLATIQMPQGRGGPIVPVRVRQNSALTLMRQPLPPAERAEAFCLPVFLVACIQFYTPDPRQRENTARFLLPPSATSPRIRVAPFAMTREACPAQPNHPNTIEIATIAIQY